MAFISSRDNGRHAIKLYPSVLYFLLDVMMWVGKRTKIHLLIPTIVADTAGMLIFFDIIMGLQRVADAEGAEFDNIEAARAEARTIASDIVIEELRRGGNVGADWRIDVRDVAGTILAQVLFYEVVFEPIANSYTATSLRRHLLGDPVPIPSYHRSVATVTEARAIAANVRNVFREIKQRLDEIT